MTFERVPTTEWVYPAIFTKNNPHKKSCFPFPENSFNKYKMYQVKMRMLPRLKASMHKYYNARRMYGHFL